VQGQWTYAHYSKFAQKLRIGAKMLFFLFDVKPTTVQGQWTYSMTFKIFSKIKNKRPK
jgi:hypothetical protein